MTKQVLATFLFALAAGCDPLVGESESSLVEPPDMIGGPIWSTPTIPVCHEEVTPDDADARAWIQDAVESRWERVSAVDFVGWGPCVGADPGIHVSNKGATGVVQYGADLDGIIGGLSIFIGEPRLGTRDEIQIRSDAIRMFGHALGFRGPSAKENAPDGSIVLPDPIPTTFLDGPSWPAELSVGAVRAVQAYYGAAPGTVTLGPAGECLTAAVPDVRIAVARCDESPEQQFPHIEVWAPPRTHRPFRSMTNMCLEQDTTARFKVCAEEPSLWRPGVNQRNRGGTGLLETAGEYYATYGQGTTLALWKEQGRSFTFDFESWFGFSIFDSDLGRCLVPASDVVGAEVVLRDACDADDAFTKWIWRPGGALVHSLTGLCLMPATPFTRSNGLITATCTGGTAQRWSLLSNFVDEHNDHWLEFMSTGDHPVWHYYP
jgi:hypothetical protein